MADVRPDILPPKPLGADGLGQVRARVDAGVADRGIGVKEVLVRGEMDVDRAVVEVKRDSEFVRVEDGGWLFWV